eukprot:TRINITY_DN911_c3_g1_i1.p2 TRINITY_DN911_c3_g1~~TRINITY_DN911_c3_g1_i1.p2  ORF type:complete len:248 (-),score=66.81 TRINITY_DN911_c3_g1_i1:1623-2366(-)
MSQLMKTLATIFPQTFTKNVQNRYNRWRARREVNKQLKKEIAERFLERNLRYARTHFFEQDVAPLGQRAKWISKKNPYSWKVEWADAFAEKLEEKLGYDPDAMKEDASSAEPRRTASGRSMHITEAVQVLQLTEATEAHVVDRFNFLVAANTFKGSSEYIQEKLEAAQTVAIKYQREGRLIDFIKKKPKEGEEEAQPQQQQQQQQTAAEEPAAEAAGQAEGEAKASSEGADSTASSNGTDSNTTKQP